MPDGDVEINADRAKSEALARAQQIAQQLASQKSSNNTPPTSSFSSSGGVGYSQNNSNNHFSATATYGQPDSHLHGLTNGDENSGRKSFNKTHKSSSNCSWRYHW